MRRRQLILLLTILVCICTIAPLMLFKSLQAHVDEGVTVITYERVETAQTPITVGVILTGNATDFGWDDVAAGGADFVETTINGNTVIVFDRLNATSRPGLTLAGAVDGVLERGATVIFVSPAYLSEADETRVSEQHPNTVFIMNLSTRANVERLLSVLPGTLSDMHSGAFGDSAATAPTTAPTFTETTGLDPDGPAVVLPSMLIAVIVVGIGLLYAVRSNRRASNRDTDLVKTGRKRKLHSSSGTYHTRGLALENTVRSRMTDFVALDGKHPVIQKLSTYVSGDRHFDESFPVELASGEFLGECGLNIGEQVNRYDRDKITAFELWLFDKRAISTATAVLTSEYAANNATMRTKLTEKGEVRQAGLDRVITLETDTLFLEARILAMDYGFADTLPANSFFDHLVVEIAVFQR